MALGRARRVVGLASTTFCASVESRGLARRSVTDGTDAADVADAADAADGKASQPAKPAKPAKPA